MKRIIESVFYKFSFEYENLKQEEKINFWGKVFVFSFALFVVTLTALIQNNYLT